MKYIILLFSLNQVIAQSIDHSVDFNNRLKEINFSKKSNIKYSFDKNGNRISQRITTANCPLNYVTYHADTTDPNIVSYQWQVKSTNNFVNVSNGANYQGASSATLQLVNVPTSWYGYVYRCRITYADGTILYNPTHKLVFALHWTGAASKDWHNPLNWDCSIVPDEFTDVYIDQGSVNYPEINAPAVCRSLNSQGGTGVEVKEGVTFKVMGKL